MKARFLQIFVCVAGLGAMLYSYLSTQNALVQRRMRLPALVKEVSVIREENTRLIYDIERFEDPKNLMQLAKDFRHLKQPSTAQTDLVPCGLALGPNHAFEEREGALLAKAP